MEQSEKWRPLLDGELAAEAWRAVREVAEALREPSAATAADPTLAAGSAGIALFHTYLAQALSEDVWADAAASHFDRMVEAVPSAPLQPGLFGGLVGIGWTIEHLRGRLFAADAEEEDDNREIDEALLPALLRVWTGDYDLLRGLVGIGVYFHERLARPTARPDAEIALRRILVQLMNSVEERDGGLTWHTSPELLPPDTRKSHPQGYYNAGMAHGVPGVIALLALLCEAGFDQSGGLDSDARPLLAGAVDWLLARELPSTAPTRFPHLAGPGIAPAPSRLAWCYGDPGIAVALLGAARRSGNVEWGRAARRIALDAAARSPEGSRVIDASLCHGAAGLSHLFHRLHQATGEEALAAAGRFWFRQALEHPVDPAQSQAPAPFRSVRPFQDLHDVQDGLAVDPEDPLGQLDGLSTAVTLDLPLIGVELHLPEQPLLDQGGGHPLQRRHDLPVQPFRIALEPKAQVPLGIAIAEEAGLIMSTWKSRCRSILAGSSPSSLETAR